MNTSSSKRPKVCGNKCVVCGKSKFSHAGLKLFIFPRKDEVRCEKWINSTGYFELKYLPSEAKRYVCELHFDDKDFMSVLKNRLMPNAVPKKSNVQLRVQTNKPTSYYRSSIKQSNQNVRADQPVVTSVITTNQQSNYATCSKDIRSNHDWPLIALANAATDNLQEINYQNDEYIVQQDNAQKNVKKVTSEADANSQQYHSRRKAEFIPMIQPYYKRNCRPAPCKHCKRKDKTIIALRKRVRELKRTPFKTKIDQLKNISDDSKTFAKMFLTHGSHRVWTEEEKTFAIDLLNKSSSAYYFLRHNKKLILPSKASVLSWIKERTKDSSEEQQIKNVNDSENIANLNSTVISEIQQIHHIPNNIMSTMETMTPMSCTVELPMAHPNDSIISIPEVTANDMPTHLQTITTLEPMQHLSSHDQSHLATTETHYKYAYQIITQEGMNNKSTYIIHLNES